MGKSETISYKQGEKEDLEKEDLARQNEIFLLQESSRLGFPFKKEDLDKPVTLRQVLQILFARR